MFCMLYIFYMAICRNPFAVFCALRAESQDYKMRLLGGSVSQVFYSEKMHTEHLPVFPSHEERAGIACTSGGFPSA